MLLAAACLYRAKASALSKCTSQTRIARLKKSPKLQQKLMHSGGKNRSRRHAESTPGGPPGGASTFVFPTRLPLARSSSLLCLATLVPAHFLYFQLSSRRRKRRTTRGVDEEEPSSAHPRLPKDSGTQPSGHGAGASRTDGFAASKHASRVRRLAKRTLVNGVLKRYVRMPRRLR